MTKGSFGERIYMWRRRRGLNQQQLADMARINRVTVAKLERGTGEHVEAETVKRLAQALRVKTDYLLGLVGEEDAEADYSLAEVCTE